MKRKTNFDRYLEKQLKDPDFASRLESTSYEGHSLSMLRRVAEVLGARVHIDIQLLKRPKQAAVAEDKATYGNNH